MINPFDNEDNLFIVLTNSEEQYSLWPADLDIPAGWEVNFSSNTRQACLDFIDTHWTNIRPRSLAEIP